MAINKRLLVKPPSTGITPSEHFGVVLYEGDGSTSHSINGGKFGAGAYFDGTISTSTIFASNLDGTVLPTDKPWSASFWLNTSASTTGNQTPIAHMKTSSPYSGWAILIGATTIDLAINGSTPVPATGSKPPRDNNNWHHFVLSYDGSGTTTLYYDGSFKGTFSGTIGASDSHLKLGTANVWSGYKGKIDQVRMFTKALSSSQAATLYAETAATVESLDPLSEDTTDTLQVLGDSSCVAHYKFENNENDESGNFNGTGTAIQYAAGRYGQAASFNGSSSNVDIGSFGSVFQQNFTVSLWFNLNSLSALNNLFSSQDDYYTYIMARNDTNKVQAQVEIAPSTAYAINSGTITTNTWYHAVITVSSTDGFKFYMNNELQGTESAATGNLQTMSGNSFIGAYQSTTPGTFEYPTDGKIDQVRVFNKALSSSEVTTLYNENSLVASYRFEGNANDDMRTYDGTATNVTYEYGIGFTPDFVWVKERSAAESHRLFDTTRGATKRLFSDNTNAESTATDSLTSFDTGGFTVGSSAAVNQSGQDYVGWAWKANGGTTSSNTDGTITSTVQVNADAGFSIATWDGNGSSASIGHGLGVAPDMLLVKNLDGTNSWIVRHKDFDGYLSLEQSAAGSSSDVFGTAPDATKYYFNTAAGGNGYLSANTYVGYFFASIEGFSKFGSYTGNGSDNGPIVETGFEPAFLMFKRTDSASAWVMIDNARDPSNPRLKYLMAQGLNSEASDLNGVDFLANGFQIKDDYADWNTSGSPYIYMAFAADPDTEAPTVAKSFSTVTYTGNGGTQTIEGLGFKPGLIWMKRRDTAQEHALVNIVSGPLKHLYSDLTSAEQTTTNGVSSFNDDGWTMGANGLMNNTNNTYVGWSWKADDNEPTIFPPNQTVADIKSTNLTLNLNLAAGSYSGSGSAIEDLSSAEEDFTVTNASVNEGYGGYYIDFDGSGDYADSDSSIATTTGNDITIEFWVRSESGSQTSYADIMDANHSTAVSGSTGEGWAIQMRATNQNSFYFVYYDGSGYQSNSDGELFTITNNEWTHIAIVKSGTSVQVYKNGSAGNSWTAGSATLANPNQKIRLAGWLAGGRDFNGSLGQVRLYSDALSAGEVLGNYNATKGLFTVTESVVSANANAGMSIVKFNSTTNASTASTFGHGLSAAPEMIILKRIDGVEDWYVYHTSLGNAARVQLNSTAAKITGTNVWGQTNPTATVFTVESFNPGNAIAYCFHSVSGYSKFGSYAGTGSSNSITGLGFQPDFVMVKNTDSARGWQMFDSIRGANKLLFASSTSDESNETAGTSLSSFDSDGFTVGTGLGVNENGDTFIYMAFKIN